MNHPKATVIIAVYKNIPFLDIVLQGLARQSCTDFEVIVAEDNDAKNMSDFVIAARKQYTFPIQHVSQPDNGFRKCAILNSAIRVSQADYLIFIDGDCIPHRHFVAAHIASMQPNVAVYGRRVMLSEQLTNKLTSDRHLAKLTFLNLFRYRCQRLDAAWYLPFLPARHVAKTGIWGCNWSIHKSAMLAINGFDEDYTAAGIGEDTDLEWRLQAIGVQLQYVKFRAIQYHLYHAPNYADTTANEALLAQKKIKNQVKCPNGLRER